MEMQAHRDSERVLEGELAKLRHRVELKEREWLHQEQVLQQAILDKEKQLERYGYVWQDGCCWKGVAGWVLWEGCGRMGVVE